MRRQSQQSLWDPVLADGLELIMSMQEEMHPPIYRMGSNRGERRQPRILDMFALNDFHHNFMNSHYPGLDLATENSMAERPRVKKVLSAQGQKDLKVIPYKKDFVHGKLCPITCCEFKEGDKVTCLPCGHYFDSSSINKWLNETSSRCPVCRNELPYKEISELPDDQRSIQPRETSLMSTATHAPSPFVTVLTYNLTF